jgi:hypothetical protein
MSRLNGPEARLQNRKFCRDQQATADYMEGGGTLGYHAIAWKVDDICDLLFPI